VIKLSCLNREILTALRNSDQYITKGEEFSQITLDFESISLSRLITYFSSDFKFYFKTKGDNAREIFALGNIEVFKSHADKKKISSIIKTHDFLKVLGGERFNKKELTSKKEDQWEELEETLYFIPRVVFENSKVKINIKNNEEIKNIIIETMELLMTSNDREEDNFIISSTLVPDQQEWNTLISKAHHCFDQGEFEKVVLHRQEIVSFSDSINSEEEFLKLIKGQTNEAYQLYFKYAHNDAFMSVTPECLYRVNQGMLQIDSLAGTTQRGADDDEDYSLATKLINDHKELSEHRFVTDYIISTLQTEHSKKVSNITKNNIESILKLKFVQHIHTEISADIECGEEISLLSSLHPTPAVGGLPKKSAMDFILENEHHTRGFYAAPMGYFSKNESNMCVAIRCARVKDNQISIYGGCGVVKESLALNEWNETAVKMQNFQKFLRSNK